MPKSKKSASSSKKSGHWDPNRFYPIKVISEPFQKENVTVVTVHYIGWPAKYNEDRPVSEIQHPFSCRN